MKRPRWWRLGWSFKSATLIPPNIYCVEATHTGIFSKTEHTFLYHNGTYETRLFEMPGWRRCGIGLQLKVKAACEVMAATGVILKSPAS